MFLFILTLDGNTIEYKVNQSDTVLDIKKYLEEKEGINASEINLFFNKELLSDSKILIPSEIKEESTLKIALKIPGFRNVTINYAGRNWQFEVDPLITINELRLKLKEVSGISEESGILICSGKTLAGQNSLQDCNLPNKAKIFLVYPFRG